MLVTQQATLRQKQLEKAAEIYRQKVALRDEYVTYYGAVQSFLATHPLAKSQDFKLTFNVAVSEHDFAIQFQRLLNLRRTGSFSGIDVARERIKLFLQRTDFDSEESVLAFLGEVMAHLYEDRRDGRDSAPQEIRDQLAQGVKPVDLYDFVFGLSYLEPIYNLRWDGKTIDQLSPGERGNLLLIFYLLIDQDDIPLVIDQPEENLDNNSVFRTLVPCVKAAKKRRQIVIVTHNPNLAVVCDAEQIICSEMIKDGTNRVAYTCGSIEDPEINRRIVNILEGTRPAFDKRDSKYQKFA